MGRQRRSTEVFHPVSLHFLRVCKSLVNSPHPDISMYIFLTVLYTILREFKRRTYLTIKRLFGW